MKNQQNRVINGKKVDPYRYSMSFYENTLNQITDVVGNGSSLRQDKPKLNVRMKVGNIYAVRANDDPNYFFTITLQNDPFTGGFRKLVSQLPVYGDIPPGMEEISAEQVYKQFRELNGGALSHFQAFPYKGIPVPPQGTSGNDLVTQNHLNQLKRTGR